MSSVKATKSASQRFTKAEKSGGRRPSGDLKMGRGEEGLKGVLAARGGGAPQPLACPFRKRRPLKFNIREASSCCRAFNAISDVMSVLLRVSWELTTLTSLRLETT